MFLSNRKLKLFIISLLLLIFSFILGIFNVKASEIASTSIYGLNINDSNGVHWNTTSCGYMDFGGWNVGIGHCPINNINFDQTLTARLFLGNASQLGYHTISFVVYTRIDYVDVTAIFISDNERSFSCEIYNAVNNENTNAYNVICPNLPSFTGNATSINETLSWTGGGGTFVHNVDIGISNIVMWSSQETSINDIKNQTTIINNSINDSSIDSSGASSSASDWNNKNATNGTITNLLTLPITLLQAIVNGLQTSCSSFSLGSLFGTNISLPCINVGNLIGSGLWSTIDILFSGFMILAIAKKLIKIFNDFTNLKSNQIDELYGGGNK